MYEMSDLAQQEENVFEPRSRSVSFPDHYLLPYIEMCKNSKRITCGCSLMFIGLAIFCFFATSYMINYPVTESRKIAFVFAGVMCIVAAVSCLDLRFGIFNDCRNAYDDTVFEIAPRDDIVTSDSFSGHFEMQELPFANGTPREGLSQSETPDNSSSLAHSVDESFGARISAFMYSGRGRLPRHSISDGMSPDIPLLPLRRTVELPSSAGMQNRMDSKLLQIGGTVHGSSNYPPNYSTFDNSRLVLVASTFENDCDVAETEPLLVESSFENSCEVPETEPLLVASTFENDCDVSETEPLLVESSYENICEISETESSLVESSLKNGYEVSETEPFITESALENGCEILQTEPLLAASMFKNDRDVSETEKLLSQKF